jgi:hypothetical protein
MRQNKNYSEPQKFKIAEGDYYRFEWDVLLPYLYAIRSTTKKRITL